VISDDLDERLEAHPFATADEVSIAGQVGREGRVDERPRLVFDVDDLNRSRPGGNRDPFTRDGGLYDAVVLEIAALSSGSEPVNRLQGRELNAALLAVDRTDVFDDQFRQPVHGRRLPGDDLVESVDVVTGLTVDRCTRGGDDAIDSQSVCGLEDVEGPPDVDLDGSSGRRLRGVPE